MRTARLLTAGATTGWRDWIHGQLWLLDGGLLRVATDLRTTLRQGAGPTVPGDEVVTADITRAEAEAEAARHRRSVWVSREEIDSAGLPRHAGAGHAAPPLATHRARTDIDRALQAFLLDSVDHGTYVPTHEHFWDLDGHVETQHNPDARELAASHGFVRQA